MPPPPSARPPPPRRLPRHLIMVNGAIMGIRGSAGITATARAARTTETTVSAGIRDIPGATTCVTASADIAGAGCTGDPVATGGSGGTLVNPSSLSRELAQLLSRGVAEYQVVLTKENRDDAFSQDVMVVRLACAPGDRERVAQEVRSLVLSVVEITPETEFVPIDGFSEIAADYKFSRFVDER